MPSNNSHKRCLQVEKDEDLWRRIHITQLVRDEKGNLRPMSGAFKGRDISVDIGRKTTPEKSIANSAGLVTLKAEIPISLGHQVVENPIPQNPAHALILGTISGSKAKIIRDNSKWIIPPEKSHTTST